MQQRTDPAGNVRAGLLLTPAAAARQSLPARSFGGRPARPSSCSLAPGDDVLERVRNAATAIDPAVSALTLQRDDDRDRQFASLRRAVLAGAAATLLLVGASLLVSLLEQVRDRRRLLAVLAAFGTRRATLGWSVLYQTAVPVALGLALAVRGRPRARRSSCSRSSARRSRSTGRRSPRWSATAPRSCSP